MEQANKALMDGLPPAILKAVIDAQCDVLRVQLAKIPPERIPEHGLNWLPRFVASLYEDGWTAEQAWQFMYAATCEIQHARQASRRP